MNHYINVHDFMNHYINVHPSLEPIPIRISSIPIRIPFAPRQPDGPHIHHITPTHSSHSCNCTTNSKAPKGQNTTFILHMVINGDTWTNPHFTCNIKNFDILRIHILPVISSNINMSREREDGSFLWT